MQPLLLTATCHITVIYFGQNSSFKSQSHILANKFSKMTALKPEIEDFQKNINNKTIVKQYKSPTGSTIVRNSRFFKYIFVAKATKFFYFRNKMK